MTDYRALFGAVTAFAVVSAGLASCAPTSDTEPVGAAAPAASPRQQMEFMVADDKAEVFEMIDLGKSGFGPGDELVEQAPVVDANGKTIGTTYTTVVIVSGTGMGDAKGIVDCTVELSDGNLLFHGAFDLKQMATGAPVPVVGGTAAYEGASGTVMMTAPTDKATELRFDFAVPSSP